MGQNKILDASNESVKTSLMGLPNQYDTLNGLPLGVTDSGEIFVKTGGTGGGGSVASQVEGVSSAAGPATSSVNPVVIGFNNSLDGTIRVPSLDGAGAFQVTFANGFLQDNAGINALSTSSSGPNASGNYLWDGVSNWQRQRGNISDILLTSASRTTTQIGSDIINYNARSIHFNIVVTVAGTGSITPSIEGKDANGNYYTLLTGTAITTNSTTVLKVGPGIVAVANMAATDFVPRTFRLNITANNGNPITYSAAYSLCV